MIAAFFCFNRNIILKYRSRCVSIRLLKRIDSYPVRLVSFQDRSVPASLRYQIHATETEGLSDIKTGT